MKDIQINSKVPINFFMNEEVKVEKNAIKELEELVQIKDTIETLKTNNKDFFEDKNSDLLQVSISPDFHKGAGIPIGTSMFTKGFVIPQAIGNDVNCGMRLYTTSLTEDKVRDNLPQIEKNIRHIFFEGGRNIPMTKKMREAIFKEGLIGLLETYKGTQDKGIWKYYNETQQERDLSNVNKMGSFITDNTIGLENFLGTDDISYDSQIGSIGGGNHFVEIQKVTNITNSYIANAWNLKKGQVVVMIHTGSVSIGHHSGTRFKDIVKEIYPKSLKHPENGIYVLPKSEMFKKEWDMFWTLLYNAGNFAFANRLLLGLMLYKTLSDEVNEFDYKLLYDAPHNFVWEEKVGEIEGYIHRKGSCTAKSPEQMLGTNFQNFGEPVMIPGSMGSKSYILAGLGNPNSLYSASHGAGRKLSRGESLKIDDAQFRDFISRFKIINPIDPNRPDIKGRTDIIKKWEEELKKEAPYAYKDISPIIQTHLDNNIAQIVAEVEPILTIKA